MKKFKDFLTENIDPEKLFITIADTENKLIQDLKKVKAKNFLVMEDEGIYSGYNIENLNNIEIDTLKKELKKMLSKAKFKIIKF